MVAGALEWPAFEKFLARHRELEHQLADPTVISDRARFTQVAKEHGSLAKMVKPYLEYHQVSREVAQTEALLAEATDPEMQALAEEELKGLRARQQALQGRLEDLLLIDPSEDFGSVIMEIRAGTGGDEA